MENNLKNEALEEAKREALKDIVLNVASAFTGTDHYTDIEEVYNRARALCLGAAPNLISESSLRTAVYNILEPLLPLLSLRAQKLIAVKEDVRAVDPALAGESKIEARLWQNLEFAVHNIGYVLPSKPPYSGSATTNAALYLVYSVLVGIGGGAVVTKQELDYAVDKVEAALNVTYTADKKLKANDAAVEDAPKSFTEGTLRSDIVKVWGPAGAHVDVYDHILARLALAEDLLSKVSRDYVDGVKIDDDKYGAYCENSELLDKVYNFVHGKKFELGQEVSNG